MWVLRLLPVVHTKWCRLMTAAIVYIIASLTSNYCVALLYGGVCIILPHEWLWFPVSNDDIDNAKRVSLTGTIAVEEIAGFSAPFSVVSNTAAMDVDTASCELHSTYESSVDSTLRVPSLEARFFADGKLEVSDVQEKPRGVRFTGDIRSDTERAVLESICDPAVLFHRVSTTGDGSCGIHAAFGLLSSLLPLSAKLFCENARCAAVNALRMCRTDVHGNRFWNSATRVRMIWNELTFPCAKSAEVPDFKVEDSAAQLFWDLLPPDLRWRARLHIRKSLLSNKDRKT